MANSRNDIPRGETVFRKKHCSPFDIRVLFHDISSFLFLKQGSVKSSRRCGVHAAILVYSLKSEKESRKFTA